jgi:hypothetical protein
MAVLGPTDLRRLASCLRLLASSVDGEVLGAAAAVCRILKERDLSWEQVLNLPPPQKRDWRDIVREVIDIYWYRLSPWEEEFITSLQHRNSDELSEKQDRILRRIARMCGLEEWE